jgi:hypothetical protein
MLRFVAESGGEGWPNDIAKSHDDVLAASYRSEPKRKRR